MKRKYMVIPTDVMGNRLPLDRLTPKENAIVNVVLYASLTAVIAVGVKLNTIII